MFLRGVLVQFKNFICQRWLFSTFVNYVCVPSTVFSMWFITVLDQLQYAGLFAHCFQEWFPSDIQCQLCPMMFSDQSSLSNHYETAHSDSSRRAKPGDGMYECEVCGKKFTVNGNLKRHMSTIHAVGDVRTFPCALCSRSFSQKAHLTRHMKQVHKLS